MITPADKLKGILPVIISGGRPELKQRPTAMMLDQLKGITADPVWIVSEADATGYQDDGNEIATYSREWAEDYAAAHWTGMEPVVKAGPDEKGSFLGAFPGREWACRLAEERGYWATLQLDDNIIDLSLFRRHYTSNSRIAEEEGGMGMFADVLAAITLSTNGWMVGAFLTAVPPSANEKLVVSRTGFPYSLFIERVGPNREAWVGPYEDDITHAYAYGNNPSSSQTALLVPMLNYMKEHAAQTGMRKNYNSKRAVPLQRMFPETARIGVYNGKANGRGGPRVFHKMIPGAIRTPMIITDHELYGEVKDYITGLARKFGSGYRKELETRTEDRARKARVSMALANGGEDAPSEVPRTVAEPSGDAPWWDTPTWVPDRS
jgi:TET-associated glycosyltransferase-like protein